MTVLIMTVAAVDLILATTQRPTSDLVALLERHASGFTLQNSIDAADPVGMVEFESLRERKPRGIGIYVKHLTTGQEAGVGIDRIFETQSVIKLAIMIRAYQLADAGRLDLDRRIEVRRDDMVFGSGVLRRHQAGLRPTLRDLVTEMIITSDNTATDLVLARIGGIAGLNTWLASSGYAATRMGQTAFESFRLPYVLVDAANAGLTRPEVMALRSGNASWGLGEARLTAIRKALSDLEKQPLQRVRALAASRTLPVFFGHMTPREAGRLLESIQSGAAASAKSSREMQDIMRSQLLGMQRLPHYLAYEVGHKTGDSYPWDANDVGIVYAPSGAIVIAVFANDLAGVYGEEEDRIARLGRDVVDFFERAR